MRTPHSQTPTRTAGAPLNEAKGAVILLHGRGASAESILELGFEIASPEMALIAPQADGSTWYPYSFLAPLYANEPYLSGALQRIAALVEETVSCGIDRSQIVLAGFSQGACLALEFLARSSEPVGGVIALSGGLLGSSDIAGSQPPDDKAFDYAGRLDGCSVFLGCSDVDAHIPLGRVHTSATVLLDLGAAVDARIYPGMGHTVNDDELEAARQLLVEMAGKTGPADKAESTT